MSQQVFVGFLLNLHGFDQSDRILPTRMKTTIYLAAVGEWLESHIEKKSWTYLIRKVYNLHIYRVVCRQVHNV